MEPPQHAIPRDLADRYRSTCGLSASAAGLYSSITRRFGEFLDDNALTLEDVTSDTVVAFANHVDKHRGSSTKRNIPTSIRHFFRWLEAEGLISDADGRVGAKGKHGKYSQRLRKSPKERVERRRAGDGPSPKPPGAARNRNGAIDAGIIEEFLLSRKCSKGSLAQFSCGVRAFSRYIEDIGVPFHEVTPDTIEAFGKWAEEAYAESTYLKMRSMIRGFYAWLEERGYYENVARDFASTGRRKLEAERIPLPLDDARRVLEAAGDNDNVEIALRDRMIVGMMVVSALWPFEIRSANVGDVSFIGDHGVIALRGNPRKPPSIVYLPPGVAADTRRYIEFRQAGPDEPLVASAAAFNAGDRVNATTVSSALRRAFRHAGIEEKRSKYTLQQTALELAMEQGFAGAQLRSMARVYSFASLQRLDYSRSLAKSTPQSKIEALLDDVEDDVRHAVTDVGALRSKLADMAADDLVAVSIDRTGKLSLTPVIGGGSRCADRPSPAI